MGRFDDRVAIITGAARGIGFSVARQLAEEGASVALVDLDESKAQAAAETLGGAGRHVGIGANVTNQADVDLAVRRTVGELGGLNVLVNNAGITRDNLIHKMSEDDWDSVMGVHLKGAFLFSKAAQTHFVAQRHGRIVNISSISALGNRGQANYAAAKMGIQGFTRSLAIELGPFGVTVNAVAPGFTVTEMTDATAARLKLDADEFRRVSAEMNPVRRVGYPEDIAAAVCFFASEEASYITGQNLYVDGGRTLSS